MKSIVRYTFYASVLNATDAIDDLQKMREYLEERSIGGYKHSIRFNNDYDDFARSFTLEHKSPQHRTATELMMSGCQYTCKLCSRVV